LNLHTALRQDGAQAIGVVESLLTPRFASHREEDVDQGCDSLAYFLAPAVACERAKADDEVTHLSPYPIPIVPARNVPDPFLDHTLHLQDGRHQAVDVESIDSAIIRRVRL
jgi:hypothetical protein